VRAVRFLPKAIADLTAIHEHVSAEHPRAAERLVQRITDRAFSLGIQAERGTRRPKLLPGLRFVVEEPYQIYYLMVGDVLIVRILHGARRIRRGLFRGS
jgi:plasmid stabilization system protein ParE